MSGATARRKDDREAATVTARLDDFLELVREWWAGRRR